MHFLISRERMIRKDIKKHTYIETQVYAAAHILHTRYSPYVFYVPNWYILCTSRNSKNMYQTGTYFEIINLVHILVHISKKWELIQFSGDSEYVVSGIELGSEFYRFATFLILARLVVILAIPFF